MDDVVPLTQIGDDFCALTFLGSSTPRQTSTACLSFPYDIVHMKPSWQVIRYSIHFSF